MLIDGQHLTLSDIFEGPSRRNSAVLKSAARKTKDLKSSSARKNDL